MEKIKVGTVEIAVLSVRPYVYGQGRGEKVLLIEVDENTVSFGELKAVLHGSEEPILHYVDDKLKCEYTGYDKFTATYSDGIYKVEMHMASMETKMVLVMAANERITAENARITEENAELTGVVADLQQENAALKEQVKEINVNGEATEIINAMLGLEG